MGRTSLETIPGHSIESPLFDRDFAAEKQRYDDEKAAAAAKK